MSLVPTRPIVTCVGQGPAAFAASVRALGGVLR